MPSTHKMAGDKETKSDEAAVKEKEEEESAAASAEENTAELAAEPAAEPATEPTAAASAEPPAADVDDQAVQDVVQEVVNAAASITTPPGGKKKRLCRYPGCTKVIKSQGHCQRHGARAKRCKVEGCEKQAQGTHDGMCKRHWKAVHFPSPPPKPEQVPPAPQGESVYDMILPASVSYRPLSSSILKVIQKPEEGEESKMEVEENADGDKKDDVAPAPMPLVTFLKEGTDLEAGWHRNAERRARGAFPVAALSSQLEPWERQLALLEIFLLSGGTPHANFQDLAHAWGREKGFHQLLANSVCERRGEVERKKRSDAGKTMTLAERQAFREKLKKARLSGKETNGGEAAAAETEEKQDEDGQAMETTTTNEDLKPASVEEMVDQAAEAAETVSV